MSWTLRFAVAAVLACGLALILGAGGTAHPTRPSARSNPTPEGAAAMATRWCQTTAEAFVDGGWDRAVSALSIEPFRAQALRYGPAAALVHRRVGAAHTPYALRDWPRGDQVLQYSGAVARVRVWQFLVLAIAAPGAVSGFTTQAVALAWSGGAWKVTAVSPGPDMTPPSSSATPAAIATWVDGARRLEEYRYAP